MRRHAKIAALAACVALAAPPAFGQSALDLLFGHHARHRRAAPRPAPAAPAPAKPAAPEKKPAEATKKPAETAKAKSRDKSNAQAGEKPEAAAPAIAGPPPYDPQLTRLAEVVGALAFLRDLCQAGDGDDWREKMSTLLAADAPSGPRHEKLVAAYNRGFKGFELTYRVCTPNAQAAIARYLREADRVAHDMSYRYGAP